MPLILPGNVATATASTTYEVANSVRFNKADAPALKRNSMGTATNRKKWTLSMWVKRSTTAQAMLASFDGAKSYFQFQSGGQLEVNDVPGSSFNYRLVTNAIYRDIAAWMHIVVAYDSTQGTDTNRLKLYVNGAQPTLGTATYPDQNFEPEVNSTGSHKYGSYDDSADFAFDGYFAEIVFIDGTQYAASDFGEFDEDSPTIWKPKDPSGLTFGTNGHYLDFEASGNLGNDVNGGTDFDENNIVAGDQSTDTCTNNFATWNSLFRKGTTTPAFAEGNLKSTFDDGGANEFALTTFGVSAGKWYAEVKWPSNTGTAATATGILDMAYTGTDDPNNAVTNAFGYFGSGTKNVSGTASSYGNSYADGDIIGIAIDMDNNKLYFSKNGTFQDSGDPTSGSTGTGAISIVSGVTYGIFASDYNSQVAELNTGSPPFSISSGNSDANGYGNFEYAVPSGYLAICTKNLGSDGG